MMDPCMDCGDDLQLLVMMDTETWDIICPENKVLCIPCIEKRVEKMIGMHHIPIRLDYASKYLVSDDGGRRMAVLEEANRECIRELRRKGLM